MIIALSELLEVYGEGNLLAFGGAAIGLFFGIYPASRAARQKPVTAMHHIG